VHPSLQVAYLYVHTRQISFPGKNMKGHRVHQDAIQVEDEGKLPGAVVHAERIACPSTITVSYTPRENTSRAFLPVNPAKISQS
jgi:hypothetical protein